MRPNFFIVGAPKCGTTAWAEYLSEHPEIGISKSKEPHYFNTDFPLFRWAKSLEEYHGFFSECSDAKVIGEASVQYLYSKSAARNIFEYCPHAKILIMLRSPGSFMRSYHNQLLVNCDENITDLKQAWNLSGRRPEYSIPTACREKSFLDYKAVGLFSEQVARYYNCFPAAQIKVIFMEDWTRDPRAIYLELMSFLELKDNGRKDFPKAHEAKHVASRRLHHLTQRPPKSLKALLSVIRRVPGLRSFKPSRLIRAVNVQSGYNSSVNNELETEIEAFFADDQKTLITLLNERACIGLQQDPFQAGSQTAGDL